MVVSLETSDSPFELDYFGLSGSSLWNYPITILKVILWPIPIHRRLNNVMVEL